MLSFSSCGPVAPDAEADVGVAQLELREVPLNVNCIRVIATGPRTVVRDFQPTVLAQTSIFRLDRLPLGVLAFSAEAFAQACAALTSAAVPLWVGGPTEVTIAEGAVNLITITMQRNNRAEVTVDFDDPSCRAPGDACVDDSYCCRAPNMTSSCTASVCQQSCQPGFRDCNADPRKDGCETAILADNLNCGGCGNVCGLQCSSGLCFNAGLTIGGQRFLGLRMSTSPQVDVSATIADGGRCLAPDTAWSGKIVLCERGDAFFLAKSQNVAASGGLAVFLYDNVVSGITIGVPPDEIAEFPIPIGFFSRADGQLLVGTAIGATGRFESR